MEHINIEYRLELDPKAVNNRIDTYISLTDTYQIPLFTDRYEEHAEQIMQDEEMEEELLIGDIFSNNIVKKEETEVTERLFMEVQSDYRNVTDAGAKATPLEYLKWSAGILVLALFLLFEIWGLKRRKRKYDN